MIWENPQEKGRYAVGDPKGTLVRAADALLSIQWKTPELYGLFPNKYWMDDLTPCYEGARVDNPHTGGGAWVVAACLAYMPRVIPNLLSAALITKDRKYMDGIEAMIEKFVEKSHRFEDGDLMAPTDLSQNGEPRREAVAYPRPRYQWEIVRGLLYAYQGFKSFGDEEKAERCLDYAYRYAHVLVKMQDEDGNLYGLYKFPTLEVARPETPGWGIEGGLLVILKLADVLQEKHPEKADVLRGMCIKAVEYASKLDMLKTYCGEGSLHTVGIWQSIALLCLLRYKLCPQDQEYERYAQDAFKVSILMSMLYIDNPAAYLFAESQGSFYFAEQGDFPPGLSTKGDVMDMGSSEIGLLMKEHLSYEPGELVANYNFAGRLATSIMENGAVSGCEIDVPGYHYRKTDFSWENNQAGIGVNGCYYLTG